MANFKYGDRVFVKELNSYGRVLITDGTKAHTVKLDNGEIVEVAKLTVQLVGILKSIWGFIKKLLKL